LDEILRRLAELREFSVDNLVRVVDILLVTYLLYRLLLLVRSTRAWRILLGIVTFVLALLVSDLLGLRTLHWLLERAAVLAPVALVILLLPELRQALEGFARLALWPGRLAIGEAKTAARTVEEVVAAVAEMAAQRMGAIIVIERGTQLSDVCANGVELNAAVSAPLLVSVFYSGNPLHDGAVVVRGDQVVAAACRLPLSESARLGPELHMRHRAALGISEQSDCVAIVVSEERGTISVAIEGTLRRLDDHMQLRDLLNREVRGGTDGKPKAKRGERRGKEVAKR
jgi:diadenylate cyclase